MTDGDRAGLERGVTLFNTGYYWEAHEAWELAWIPDRYGPDRGFYKGLIQVAAGCLHFRRGNRRGALIKWESGSGLLEPYLPAHHGLDLAALLQQVRTCRSQLEGAESWPELALPLIQFAA